MTASKSESLDETTRALGTINTMVVGTAPSAAQALTYSSLAHSLSLLMHNAAQTQFTAKQVEAAAVTATCMRIVKAGAGGSGR